MSLSSFCVVSNALRLNLFKVNNASKDKRRKDALGSEPLLIEEEGEIKTLKIKGMMCEHCEARVKKALEGIKGVESATVSHKKGTAIVRLSEPVSDQVMKEAVEKEEYKVLSIS